MEFEKDRKNDQEKLKQLADVLIEAFPWVKNATGKTVVIKYGGAAMVDKELQTQVMSDIVLMKIMGLNPIIVHGGGAEISSTLKRMGIESKFVDGLRVTDEETMEVVKMVLIGKVNTELVTAMNRHGNIAVGMSGADSATVVAEPYDEEHMNAGRVTHVDSTYIRDLLSKNYIPVIASVATGTDHETFYNVNADAVAGEIAAAVGAHKVIYLTDVNGLFLEFGNEDSLISRMTLTEAEEMIASGTLSKGMIPKLASIVNALHAGVPRAHILNGTVPHSLLLEIFTDRGVGTMIMREKNDAIEGGEFETFPLVGLAEKLQD